MNNTFAAEAKNSKLYLDVATNGSGDEKALLIVEAARRLFSLEDKKHVHAVEVGPGGGSAIVSIADAIDNGNLCNEDQSLHISTLELDGIESESLKQARELIESRGATSSYQTGDIVDIKSMFGNDVDIISTSAVLHEVYSYAGGYRGIDNAISGISTVLQPGGFYAYRDVYSTDYLSLHDRTRHIYDRSTWVSFSKLFLDHYLNNSIHPYHRYEDRIKLIQDRDEKAIQEIQTSQSLSIEAPVGLLRELQRHYITLRDHLWRTGALGFLPELDGELANDWIDKRRGHKRIHYTMLEDDPILRSVSIPNSTEGSYTVDGDIFNETTEAMVGEFLDEVSEQGENSPRWSIWKEWLEREGNETYCYMSLNNLLGNIALRSFEATDGESILLPTNQTDVIVTPRAYYNRYLNTKLSNALPDGKQLILFESIPLRPTPGKEHTKQISQKVTGALGVLSVYCSQETLSSIYTPLRKALR